VSDDGDQAITMIALVGSVFSPYYAWARRRGRARAENHNALNVALYGRQARWTMTERGRAGLARSEDSLRIGPSGLHWDGSRLTIDIVERGAPIPRKVRGQVIVTPSALNSRIFELDAGGRHAWRPIAPRARIEVRMASPRIHWHGTAYWDSNWGVEPLEDRFVSWDWSRTMLDDGSSAILYHTRPRDEPARALGLRFDRLAGCEAFAPPADHPLPPTPIWRIGRGMQSEGQPPRVIRTLEDTPFYARSLVGARLLGDEREMLHESLSLTRFGQSWVQVLLPFRMPRVRR
jgi:carotenoid 1,2-hydratase